MNGPRHPVKVGTAAATSVLIFAAAALAAAPSASAFGTYNAFGQNAEHEKITRSLASEGFVDDGLDLLAGSKGNLGGAGAPDEITSILLGPGSQHCDGAGYLPGKKGSQKEADDAFRDCLRWFQWNMRDALDAAGQLVDADLTIDTGQSQASFSTCAWPMYRGADKTALCTVYNRLGRSLHLAQDFYAHSNWSDYSTGTTLDNPPGLDRVEEVPAGLRFPRNANLVDLEDGIINACDNTNVVKNWCVGRVKHDNSKLTGSDGINKDLGTVDVDNCWASKDGRHSVRSSTTDPQGRTNFARAICSAINQTKVTWGDFQKEVMDSYGDERGALIVQIIQTGTVPDTTPQPNPDTSTVTDPDAPVTTDPSDDMRRALRPVEVSR